MLLRPIYTEKIAHSSYLVGSQDRAVIIDPRRDVDEYIYMAREFNLTITHIFQTHLHADFVSGHMELANRLGAEIIMPASAGADFPHQGVSEGDEIQIGKLLFRVLETPGHTPEHIAYVLSDLDRGDVPNAVFCGDTLFVGDVGRPDLFPGRAGELTRQLFASLHEKLLQLPDFVEVYPAHGPGSLCGRAIGQRRRSTIGYEKRLNPALQFKDPDSFQQWLLEGMPPAPDHFSRLSEINRQGPRLLRELKPMATLTPSEGRRLMEKSRGIALDLRGARSFSHSHIAGSYHISTRANLPTLAGWVIPPEHPLFLISAREEELTKAWLQLHRVGLDRIEGQLLTGIQGWEAEGFPMDSLPLLELDEFMAILKSNDPPLVVDVRSAAEFASGHIPGAINIPVADLRTRYAEVPVDRPTVLTCSGGYIGSLGCSLLKQRGRHRVSNLRFGLTRYIEAGGNLV
ncbi:MAG TPA: MBL fold metallo-hydrolase [Candidatus Aminicenantes bacterium]|nr:MBL fold metallo-hydrolase [Candidatus Aminicenantes bacterium]